MTIAMINYGSGNLGSIHNMLKKIQVESVITSELEVIQKSAKIILPGVGSFDHAIKALNSSGLRATLDHCALEMKKPILGICLGMQLMTRGSEEGILEGMGWINADTVRFTPGALETLRVPHMGWNTIEHAKNSSLSIDFANEARFYFVHSYHVKCNDPSDVLMRSRYGSVYFHSAFERGNIYGCQFHPEKSHRFGMTLLENFSKI
jgi:glutamine amidotransferase